MGQIMFGAAAGAALLAGAALAGAAPPGSGSAEIAGDRLSPPPTPPPGRPQGAPPLGDWQGVLNAGGRSLRLAAHIAAAKGGYVGSFDSLDQGALSIPLAAVAFEGGALTFEAPTAHARYHGAWNAAAGRFEGDWSQAGGVWPLVLSRSPTRQTVTVQGLEGVWDGVLDVGPLGRLRVAFTFGTSPSGAVATFQSPDQGPQQFQVERLSRNGDAVEADIPAIKASFSAVRSPDGRTLAGRWSQNGTSLPLAVTRRAADAPPPAPHARPQTPRPPFPYAALEVAYDNPTQHNHLAGTLTIPVGKGPFPAVLLITGSGLQDRDETIFGHKPFLVLADDLTRRGIAVLRVDDRTMGGSTGDVLHATSADFATDVEAGIAFLRTQRAVDPKKIGLVGHSEGGLIAPMVAARNPSVAFIVMLAGPGLRGDAIILAQQRLISRAMGVPAEQVDRQTAQEKSLLRAVMSAPDGPAARKAAVAALTAGGMSVQRAEGVADQAASDWFRYFLKYDPAPALKRLKIPVLALDGGLDLQVPPAEDLAAIRAALKDNPDVTILELPGLNHLFQTAKTGAPSEYKEIEETIAPTALKIVGDWILAHTRSPA